MRLSCCALLACDCSGKISFKNLKRVAKELGENMTDEELQVRIMGINEAFVTMVTSLVYSCIQPYQKLDLNRACMDLGCLVLPAGDD